MRICFVGESFVNGTGDPSCLGWAGRICAAACQQGQDITYYNLGVRRETSMALKQRWHQEVCYRLPPDVDGRVIFCFGVNDTSPDLEGTRVPLDHSLQNAQAILQTACQQFPVLMVSPLPIADAAQNLRTAKLSQQLALLCNTLSIPYLDAFTPMQASEVWMREVAAGDGAHPGTEGYTELAALVMQWSAWQNWFQ
ncbi:MAG TPA: GDSL-type esterase/lipase family protein [Coleofasciculaceae cyanobacterium]